MTQNARKRNIHEAKAVDDCHQAMRTTPSRSATIEYNTTFR
jgi:hypothetical protein